MSDNQKQDHVVIIGWDEFSRLITRRLCKSDIPVAVITEQENALPKINEEFEEKGTVKAIHRELTSYKTFSDVDIEDSMRVFVNRDSDDDSLISILNMKKEYDDLDFVAVLENDELEKTFRNAGVTYAVSKFVIASKLVTSHMYESDVAEFETDLLAGTEQDRSDDHDLQQYLVTEDNPFEGQDYIDLFWTIKNDHNCVPVGLSRRLENGERKLIKDPYDTLTVKTGDYVLIILDEDSEGEIEALFGVNEGLNEDRVS